MPPCPWRLLFRSITAKPITQEAIGTALSREVGSDLKKAIVELVLVRGAVVCGEDYLTHTATERMVEATAEVAPLKADLFADPAEAELRLLKEQEAFAQ